MAISQTMQQAIENRDMNMIYSSFYTILLSDPGFTTDKFDEALAIVKEQNIPGFLQAYNGMKFEEENEWTQEYWDKVASELMDNFALERIEFLRKMGRKVFADAMKQEIGIELESKKKEDVQMENRYNTTSKGKLILVAAGVIILVIIVIALIV